MFGPHLKQIDEAQGSLLNQITFAGLTMHRMQKDLTDEDTEFTLRQFGIVRTSHPLEPLGPAPANISATAGYLADRIQTFRQEAGAPDTMQAVVSSENVTATAVSLAMNEAVRSTSVQAEMLAPVLLADHIKVILQNAQKYNTQPMTLAVNGVPMTVLPEDLMIDTTVRVKTTTDQDFRPNKLQRIERGLLVGTQMAPILERFGKKFNPTEPIKEYFKLLDTPNYTSVIEDISEADLMNAAMAQQIGLGGQPPAENIPEEEVPSDTMSTPVGEVLSAPGDEAKLMDTVDKAR